MCGNPKMLSKRNQGASSMMDMEIRRYVSSRENCVGGWHQPREGGANPLWWLPLLIVAWLLATAVARATVTIDVEANGGVTITPPYPPSAPGHSYSTSFGNVNGLGIGPGSGLTVISTGVTGGVLYTTPYTIVINETTPEYVTIKAYVSHNFTNSTNLTAEDCYPTSGCTAAGGYGALSVNSGAPTTITSAIVGAGNTTYNADLGVFVAQAIGAVGADSATLTFTATELFGNTATATLAVSLNVQEAVQLTMAQASGGLAISAGSGTDYGMNFGTVNGLGLAPASGLTVTSVTGGVVYATPYQLQPVFTGGGTGALETYVSMNFTNNTVLQAQTATAIGGPFTAISTSSAAQTVLSSSIASGTNFTGYLGLFVSNVNGAGAFNGTDNATITYTLTVP